MATLQQIVLDCPLCGTMFRSFALVSADPVALRRTDFLDQSAGTDTLPYLVHTCGRCGYSGRLEAFGDDAAVDPALRVQVLTELAPLLPADEPWTAPALALRGSEKYEAAAKVAEWQGAHPREAAGLLLCAAWCCVDEGDIEAERYFRREAARAYERALGSDEGVPEHARAVLTYLVGELWRRAGDARRAASWFDRVADEAGGADQRWIVALAQQQRESPREWL